MHICFLKENIFNDEKYINHIASNIPVIHFLYGGSIDGK